MSLIEMYNNGNIRLKDILPMEGKKEAEIEWKDIYFHFYEDGFLAITDRYGKSVYFNGDALDLIKQLKEKKK